MMVEPECWKGVAVWHHRSEVALAVGVWTEKRNGLGEDAEPLFVHHVPTREGVAGVFDGLGGAGSSPAYDPGDGTVRTGAWVGSRTARAAVESWFCRRVEKGAHAESESLDGHLGGLLAEMRPDTRSKVVGTMRKDLPTTMAVTHYQLTPGQVHCNALWAGDSRAYLLTPRSGLQVLTRDHTEDTDTLEQLRSDPPMTNVLRAGRFVIESNKLTVGLPSVLVTATDGFFGYVRTPAHFECHLLRTLQQARDESDWGRLLARAVTGYTGDDASVSIVALGFADFRDLAESFAPRAGQVIGDYLSPPAPPEQDHAASHEWQELTWRYYRDGYERQLPPITEERR